MATMAVMILKTWTTMVVLIEPRVGVPVGSFPIHVQDQEHGVYQRPASLGLGGQKHGTHQPNRMRQLLSIVEKNARYFVCLLPIMSNYSLRQHCLDLIGNLAKVSGQVTRSATGLTRKLSQRENSFPASPSSDIFCFICTLRIRQFLIYLCAAHLSL